MGLVNSGVGWDREEKEDDILDDGCGTLLSQMCVEGGE